VRESRTYVCVHGGEILPGHKIVELLLVCSVRIIFRPITAIHVAVCGRELSLQGTRVGGTPLQCLGGYAGSDRADVQHATANTPRG
jgi:hypothetical protein